ncbi:related to UPF0001 protein YBL036C [Hanseniaspora guilliermondii]|uniref:Pyridoxal phosphate homeostasis protein n=1 Tax=Hanseniaspora guilliermondii TaxID=56406 RepID=A0A1L0B3N5_9ASCO|nr:related to UPF0001 protein YBL036C [Hanseniaspora guilliermondii]
MSSSIINNYNRILGKINNPNVLLLPVSKFKPSSDILILYNTGVKQFGENYVQELVQKQEELPKDIKWFFIGQLQSNKCKDLAYLSNLNTIESINTLKQLKKIEQHRSDYYNTNKDLFNESVENAIINIKIQINTSKEAQKGGLSSFEEIVPLIDYLTKESKFLKFDGLMTIGSFANSTNEDEINEDFEILGQYKLKVHEAYNIPLENIKLSMGMSHDFEKAIKQGSNEIRIGTDIFGAR